MNTVIKTLKNIFQHSEQALKCLSISPHKYPRFKPTIDTFPATGNFSLSRQGNVYTGFNHSVSHRSYLYAFGERLGPPVAYYFDEYEKESDKYYIDSLKNAPFINLKDAYIHYVNKHPDGQQLWVQSEYEHPDYLGLAVCVSDKETPSTDDFDVYFVPRNWNVIVDRNVWHCPPFAIFTDGINTRKVDIRNVQNSEHKCDPLNLMNIYEEYIHFNVDNDDFIDLQKEFSYTRENFFLL